MASNKTIKKQIQPYPIQQQRPRRKPCTIVQKSTTSNIVPKRQPIGKSIRTRHKQKATQPTQLRLSQRPPQPPTLRRTAIPIFIYIYISYKQEQPLEEDEQEKSNSIKNAQSSNSNNRDNSSSSNNQGPLKRSFWPPKVPFWCISTFSNKTVFKTSFWIRSSMLWFLWIIEWKWFNYS